VRPSASGTSDPTPPPRHDPGPAAAPADGLGGRTRGRAAAAVAPAQRGRGRAARPRHDGSRMGAADVPRRAAEGQRPAPAAADRARAGALASAPFMVVPGPNSSATSSPSPLSGTSWRFAARGAVSSPGCAGRCPVVGRAQRWAAPCRRPARAVRAHSRDRRTAATAASGPVRRADGRHPRDILDLVTLADLAAALGCPLEGDGSLTSSGWPGSSRPAPATSPSSPT
jgi:hypothetical protein